MIESNSAQTSDLTPVHHVPFFLLGSSLSSPVATAHKSPPHCAHKEKYPSSNKQPPQSPSALCLPPQTISFSLQDFFLSPQIFPRIFCVALLLGFLLPSSPPTPIIRLPTDLLCFSVISVLSSPSCFFFLPAERQLRAVPRA